MMVAAAIWITVGRVVVFMTLGTHGFPITRQAAPKNCGLSLAVKMNDHNQGCLSALAEAKSNMISSQVICLYFDVLGFKERTRRAERAGGAGGAGSYLLPLNSIMSSVVSRINERAGWTDPPSWHWRLFSDNVLVWHVIHSDDAMFELAGIMAQASWAQLELGAAGYFIRGGITLGQLYWDEHIVSGEPLFEAVEMEKAARFPRLLLSPALIERAAQDVESYTTPSEGPFIRDLWRSSDGLPFISFLNALSDEDELLERDKRRLHENFRIHLARQTAASTGEARDKMMWLNSYHDQWVCENAPEENRERLLLGVTGAHVFSPFMHPVRCQYLDLSDTPWEEP